MTDDPLKQFVDRGRAAQRAADEIIDETALLGRMVEELANRAPFQLVLNGTATIQLAGLLQLALRHPQLDENNRRTAVLVIEHVRAYFGDAPATLEAMRQGDDPRHDRPWGSR